MYVNDCKVQKKMKISLFIFQVVNQNFVDTVAKNEIIRCNISILSSTCFSVKLILDQ